MILYLIKSDKKYWIVSIPLWTLLISGFIIWRTAADKHYELVERDYWKSAEIKGYDYEKGDNLEKSGKSNQRNNMIFLNAIVLQTFITFVLQIVGQSQTAHKGYRWTKYIFGILAILAFLLIAMIGIVPTGGIIGIKRHQLPLICGLLLCWPDVVALGCNYKSAAAIGASFNLILC